MTDIVERLRRLANMGILNGGWVEEAADEIERLRVALQDVASTLDWQRPGSMEGRLREVALTALKLKGS